MMLSLLSRYVALDMDMVGHDDKSIDNSPFFLSQKSQRSDYHVLHPIILQQVFPFKDCSCSEVKVEVAVVCGLL